MTRFPVVASLVAVLAAGCFFPSLAGLGDLDDQVPFPSVLATYTTGSASVTITQDGAAHQVQLGRVGRGSHMNSFFGSSVTWRSDDGWILVVTTYDAESIFGPRPSGDVDHESYSGDVSVERIEGHEFWRADSYGPAGNRCIVDLAEVSETEIRGSATCRGLRWADGTVPQFNPEPVLIEGQEPFDAEITFEARP